MKKIHQQNSSPILLSPGAAVAAPQVPSRRSPCAAAATGRPMAACGAQRPASFSAGGLHPSQPVTWLPERLPLSEDESPGGVDPRLAPGAAPTRRGRIAGRRGSPPGSRGGSPAARTNRRAARVRASLQARLPPSGENESRVPASLQALRLSSPAGGGGSPAPRARPRRPWRDGREGRS